MCRNKAKDERSIVLTLNVLSLCIYVLALLSNLLVNLVKLCIDTGSDLKHTVCVICWLHKQDRPGPVTNAAMSTEASKGVHRHPFSKAFNISHKKPLQADFSLKPFYNCYAMTLHASHHIDRGISPLKGYVLNLCTAPGAFVGAALPK